MKSSCEKGNNLLWKAGTELLYVFNLAVLTLQLGLTTDKNVWVYENGSFFVTHR